MGGRSLVPFETDFLFSCHKSYSPFFLHPHLYLSLLKGERAMARPTHVLPTKARAKRELDAQEDLFSLQSQLAYPKSEPAQFKFLSRQFVFSNQLSTWKVRWLTMLSIGCKHLRALPLSSVRRVLSRRKFTDRLWAGDRGSDH